MCFTDVEDEPNDAMLSGWLILARGLFSEVLFQYDGGRSYERSLEGFFRTSSLLLQTNRKVFMQQNVFQGLHALTHCFGVVILLKTYILLSKTTLKCLPGEHLQQSMRNPLQFQIQPLIIQRFLEESCFSKGVGRMAWKQSLSHL